MTEEPPILLVAALRDEMEPVAAALKLPKYGSPRRGPVGDQNIIAIVTGIGAMRMTATLVKAIETHHPKRILLIGFSGGLSLSLNTGDTIRATCVLNGYGSAIQLDGEFPIACATDSQHNPATTLLTTDRVVNSPGDKQSLGKKHLAAAVDMESFHVAKLAAERQMPLTIIRAISDACDFALPPQVADWVNPDGTPRVSAVLRSLAWKPSLLPTLLKLQSHTKTAASKLAAAVIDLLH